MVMIPKSQNEHVISKLTDLYKFQILSSLL